MSASKPEQIDIKTKSSFRKQRRKLKKRTNKYARRQGKKLKEDAPPRNTAGWLS